MYSHIWPSTFNSDPLLYFACTVHFHALPSDPPIFLFIQNNLIMTNNHPVFKTELQWANRSDKSHIHSLLALKLAYPSFYTNYLWEICWKWKPVFVLNIVLLGNQPEYKFCLSFISYNQRSLQPENWSWIFHFFIDFGETTLVQMRRQSKVRNFMKKIKYKGILGNISSYHKKRAYIGHL